MKSAYLYLLNLFHSKPGVQATVYSRKTLNQRGFPFNFHASSQRNPMKLGVPFKSEQCHDVNMTMEAWRRKVSGMHHKPRASNGSSTWFTHLSTESLFSLSRGNICCGNPHLCSPFGVVLVAQCSSNLFGLKSTFESLWQSGGHQPSHCPFSTAMIKMMVISPRSAPLWSHSAMGWVSLWRSGSGARIASPFLPQCCHPLAISRSSWQGGWSPRQRFDHRTLRPASVACDENMLQTGLGSGSGLIITEAEMGACDEPKAAAPPHTPSTLQRASYDYWLMFPTHITAFIIHYNLFL